ncbi:uncharacterized protein N7484_009372 [Penicillium longicatenatum]|uniref:uncharacterized protein n=1 Tax=Penicillium longicatenatum TaxID=1561947 RepID=UPI0025478D4D|nr:uncharacterized protein N7484_009372 [Penicillium longicatenatum]KAJ5636059.1 hypothetical protein N7484_009372 [Penicillium longicatenatum]
MEVPSQRPPSRASTRARLTQALGLQVPRARGAGRSGPRRRTGCLTCRARKVRCDETKPSCSNCDRLRLRCVYKPPIALGDSWTSPPPQSNNDFSSAAHPIPQTSPSPAISTVSASASAVAAVSAAANESHRSPDVNFFNTVLRSDDRHRTIPALASPIRRLPTVPEPYPELGGPFDMLGFMGGITSELEQKHLDLTSGLAGFASSPAPQTLPVGAGGNSGEDGQFGDRPSTLSPDAQSLLADGMSIGSASDAATTRGSWSDPGTTSYEEQLLQHFLASDPPAGLFAPVSMEWKYVRPAVLAYGRDFSPLLNALYCYADIHKAATEGGKRWRWAPTYYRVASSEIQACLLGDVSETTLIKTFATVFFLMLSELFSSPELCAPGTSYLHSAYLLLQRFDNRTRNWTGLGHLMVSWISLLDVKSLIAGREGDPLIELGNVTEQGLNHKSQETRVSRIATSEEHKEDDGAEEQFRSPSYLVYEAIVGPAFRFFVQAQQVVRRIVSIDLHHRSRGTLSDEFEVLQIAHKVGADLETLWHRRPSVIDVYGHPEALTDTLCAPVALNVCRTFRQYVASFLANFIYLHRVAFAIYPRTDRVNGAVNQIIQLATVESAGAEDDRLPVSFLWPLFIAGLEGSIEQRQWVFQEMQRMASARENESATSIGRHPAADQVLLLLEEMTRRQDASRTWADSRCVRRELFSDFFILI